MWKLVIACLFLGWYACLLLLGFLALYGARQRHRVRKRPYPLQQLLSSAEGVSILRPLKGFDPNMYENLETTFKQTYPKYEIIFAIADEDDPCIPLVRELIAKYPQVDARIDLGEEIVGINPKINNLMPAYRTVKYDILWVLDSNVLIQPETLTRSIESLTSTKSSSRVALVHHVPYATFSSQENVNMIGTHLERAYLNTNHARMYISLNLLGTESCVMGKSNLYRKSDLERVDGSCIPLSQQDRRYAEVDSLMSVETTRGLAAFGKFAAEDAQIGLSIWHELGLSHVLGADVAASSLGRMSFSAYFNRRVRWVRVRKEAILLATILEPCTESVLSGIALSWAVSYMTSGQISIGWAFLIHWLIWLTVDLEIRYYLTSTPFKSFREAWVFILAWVGREVLTFPIWLVAIWGNEIEWRGIKYRMSRGGIMNTIERPKRERRRSILGRRRSSTYEPLLVDES